MKRVLSRLNNKETQLKELGIWVKQHREKANLSQESAAEQAGLSRFQWLRIENGQSGTKRETLIQIAKVIGADTTKTLRKGGYTGSSNQDEADLGSGIPEKLSEIDFSVFNDQDIVEIGDFIKFKAIQKHLLTKNLSEETAEGLAKLFIKAFGKDIEGKELATNSKKKSRLV